MPMHFLYYRCILPSSSVIKCESVHFHSRVNRWNRLMKKGLRAHATLVVHPSIFLLVCHTQLKSREHQQRPVLFLHPYQHTVCLQRLLWRHFQIERCWARLHAPAPVMWPTHFIRLHQGMSCRLSQRCRRAHVCI